jgi:LemA protein
MKKKFGTVGIVLIGLVLLVAAIVSYVIRLNNNLVTMNEGIETQWSQVEVEYQRRFDLLPNLVEAVKGVLGQERAVFGDIADARTRYSGATSGSDEQVGAANDLEGSLARLLVIMEDYPELDSDETVQDLMTQIEGTENRISTERYRFNDEITDYNTTLKTFPNSVINSMFLNFEERVRFEAAAGADIAPEVDLSLDEDEE